MKRIKYKLGTFELITTKLRVSDPCYEKKTWCAGVINNCLPGIWKTIMTERVNIEHRWDVNRILIAYTGSLKNLKFKENKIHAGMDAGMIGIFDDKFYRVNYNEDYLQIGEAESFKRNGEQNDKHEYERAIKLLQNPLKLKEEMIQYYQSKIDNYESTKEFTKNYVYPITSTRDWYEICCDKSQSNIGAGVIRNGVICSSGYGDGSGAVYIAKNKDGKIIGIKVEF